MFRITVMAVAVDFGFSFFAGFTRLFNADGDPGFAEAVFAKPFAGCRIGMAASADQHIEIGFRYLFLFLPLYLSVAGSTDYLINPGLANPTMFA